jgi:hypothetical protein
MMKDSASLCGKANPKRDEAVVDGRGPSPFRRVAIPSGLAALGMILVDCLSYETYGLFMQWL